jgi:hypothetical protein
MVSISVGRNGLVKILKPDFNRNELLHCKSNKTPLTSIFNCAGNAITDLVKWRYLILVSNNKIKGLYSIRNQEVTIPGLLISYYNSKIDLCGSLFLFVKRQSAA